ncbi:AhpC/TSA family protein [Epibacterium ulvae]|uniref:AhpC/TSA family protein n=1 Tax=Epibacterium ulvae TaxID=1156985 RepID=A0A1G5QIG6_9RHOB|nr:thioredoxin family protein [Epibacterium ulvae]SCZ61594.1 AhpC/TSA family protein [Epibacterium ulvae]
MLLDTPTCDFGWKAPDFTLRDPYGTSFTMLDNLGAKGLMIAFICNHCPYVQTIGDRLAQDARTLMAEGINVVAIMSNDYRYVPQDNPENMKLFAKKFNFPFLYLIDQNQAVGKAYGAVCTPDFFGLNKEGALQYRGRLDDAARGTPKNRVPELVNAARMIAETGKGPEGQTPSIGCSIKWSGS